MPAPSDTQQPHALRRFYEAIVERQSEEDVRTRAQGGFFVFGGILAVVSLLLPHASQMFEAGIVAISLIACISGSLFLFVPQILPPQLLTWVLACGNVLV